MAGLANWTRGVWEEEEAGLDIQIQTQEAHSTSPQQKVCLGQGRGEVEVYLR